MLSVPVVGGFEGYLVENPVLKERGHEGPALGILDRRFQLGQFLLVQFQGLGRSGAVALRFGKNVGFFLMKYICLLEHGYRKKSPDIALKPDLKFESIL